MAAQQSQPNGVDRPVLKAWGLKVTFKTRDGIVEAVRGVDFRVMAGEVLGIVGESGSGKSQAVLAAMGLLASNGRAEGSVIYRGRELLGLPVHELNRIRGSKISMIFQDPLTALTPHMKVGRQITEVLTEHGAASEEEAAKRAFEMFELVRITDARRRLEQYPHELSGGMRQRVMIAAALISRPDVLIADEPTTALDVTIQAQIIDLMRELQKDFGTSVILITHDMGVIAGLCDRIEVMRHGEFVETGSAREIFYSPKHAYTRMLIEAMPSVDKPEKHGTKLQPVEAGAKPILDVRDIKVHFPVRVGSRALLLVKLKPLRAVDGVSLELRAGETLGIVGESGCGKSTLARAILQLQAATSGNVVWLGRDLAKLGRGGIRSLRREFQIVFQDPLASLDPRMTIGESVAEPLKTHRGNRTDSEIRAAVGNMMERVGLDPRWINRYPHEFSGGQNQRVGVARAMILRPKLIVCDEAVSALDVSIQAQIVKLLVDLQGELGMSMIFISHDLAVVREVSHRVMVMFLGRIVEIAGRDAIYQDPRHPYTRALISAVPVPDPEIQRAKKHVRLMGELPSPLDTRSPLAFLKSKMIDDPDAEQYVPRLIEVEPGHFVAEHDPA